MLQIYRKGYQSCENRGEWWIYQMIVESTYFLLIKNVDVRVDKQTRVPDNTNLVSTVMVLRVMVRPLWVESKKVVVVGHENWQWTNSNQTFNKAEFDMTCEHSLTLVTTHQHNTLLPMLIDLFCGTPSKPPDRHPPFPTNYLQPLMSTKPRFYSVQWHHFQVIWMPFLTNNAPSCRILSHLVWN